MIAVLLPYFEQAPCFDALPTMRLCSFYKEPEPPLAFLSGCFCPDGLHLQLRAYENPSFHSYFCFTLLSGHKLRLSKNIFPGRPDSSLNSLPIEGENLLGTYWGCELLLPPALCSPSLSAVIGLLHDNIPLCFLQEHEHESNCKTDSPYPLVTLNPEPHP